MGLVLALAFATAILLLSFRTPNIPRTDSATSLPVQTTDRLTEESDAQELEALRGHLENKPGHTPILFRMAQLSAGMGRLSEAAEHLKEILRQEPDNLEARLELGKVLYESGDVTQAIEQTKQVLEKDPKHVDALYNLGAIYANLNNLDLARQYWEQAVEADPQSESGQNSQKGLEQLRSPASLPERLRSIDSPKASIASTLR
jgi:tetratricopeptide (TPR) repeat protein